MLNVKAFALASGLLCAIGMIALAIAAAFGWGTAIIEAINTFYIGYSATPLGAVIGAIWGFIDGAIGGAIFAAIYNKFAK